MAEHMTEEQVYGLAYATIVSLQNEVAQLKAQLAKLQSPLEPDCPPEPDTPPPTTSTSNKKIIRAVYEAVEHYKIPNGIDIEDKTIVKCWCVKWGRLNIHFVNGTYMMIDPVYTIMDNEFKYPEDEQIWDADEFDYDDEE